MKPAPFAYAKARSVAHAIELLGADDARLLAGGQSLIATLNMRLSHPALLIDLNGVGGLDGIVSSNGHLEIGALVRHTQAERSAELARRAPLIALAMPHIGHPAIRNRGTIGGSVAFADPAAELPACVLALDGELAIAGPQGSRAVKADDFFKGLFETALTARDVLTAIRIPAAGAETRVGFAEFARRHGDYAMVGLAASARADGKQLRDLRLAYFGVGSTPLRARHAEQALAAGDVEAAVRALAQDLESAGRRAGVGHGEDPSRRRAAPARHPPARSGATMNARFHDIVVTVNGEETPATVDARKTLVDFLREDVGLTGSHVGCEHGVCGACSVRVDGAVVRGCLMLAVQCNGAHVETIEGVADTEEITDLQEAFIARNALQCGFCTPGMLLTAQELLAAGGVPTREQIRVHLSGNYCRCTGYQAIIDAVEAVAQARHSSQGT